MKTSMNLSTRGTWRDWLFFAALSFVLAMAQPTPPTTTTTTAAATTATTTTTSTATTTPAPTPTPTPAPSVEPVQSRVVLGALGASLNLSWPLPPGLQQGAVLLIAFNTPSTILFLTTLSFPSLPPPHGGPSPTLVMPDYSARIEVAEPWPEGLVQFTLTNVTLEDGGRYICTRGMTEADIIEDCGKTLVVLDAPMQAAVTPSGSPLIGNDATLRCSATSVSTPRDHRQPMTFRWFEAQTMEGSGAPQTWAEVLSTGGALTTPPARGRDGQQGNDAGSGEVDRDSAKGDDPGWSSNELTLTSLSTKDEGRVFACAASEGLGLWSAKSQPFVLRPEWKPVAADLTLTPTGNSMTLTSGESKVVTCHAKCRPECHVSWKKVRWDNHSLTLAKDGTLALSRVGPQHQGLYRCQASNHHGSTFTPFTLSVLDPPTPWYRVNRYVIILTAIVTVGLALGMTGVAVVVYKCRQRTTPFVWPHHRANHDAVPLSALENRYSEVPSLSSYI